MLEKYVSKLNTFFKTVWNIRKMLGKKKNFSKTSYQKQHLLWYCRILKKSPPEKIATTIPKQQNTVL